ncbi:alcohol dehydrogenase [Exophiala viscosa]|uniref:alcohol dehydrogenase n=1 Tax=Exophiala viscosa TaxID=2486360 RepID=UPI00218F3541|nr:alcohol dehydrogenase [Exophiala viscosa]
MALGNLTMSTKPMLKPGKGEVLVEIWTVSLNYRDTEVCMGTYTHHKSTGATSSIAQCSDMCGVVVEIGEGTTICAWNVGDRVVPNAIKHISVTYRVFHAIGLVKPPDYLRTGGVSICGLQIAHTVGATTIVTFSSDSKLERAKLPDTVMQITQYNGADIVFEADIEAGDARTLHKSFDCGASGGLINAIGYLSGKEDDPGNRVNANVLAIKKDATLKGILGGPKDRFEEALNFWMASVLALGPARGKYFQRSDGKELSL